MLFAKEEISNFTNHQLYKIIYSLELSANLKDYDQFDLKGMNRKTFTDIGSILDKARRAANLETIKCLSNKPYAYSTKGLNIMYYLMFEKHLKGIDADLLKFPFVSYFTALDTEIEVFTPDHMPKEKIFEVSFHIKSDNPQIGLITLLTLYTPAYDEADAYNMLKDAFMYLDRELILNTNKPILSNKYNGEL